MDWLRRRHKPEDAPTVKEAIEVRDGLFVELEGAIKEVDRVQADYQDAERDRLTRGKR